MDNALFEQISSLVKVFHGRLLPEPAMLAGYAALIEAFELKVPLPRTLCAIGAHHRIVEQNGWRLYTPRHAPPLSLKGHLKFALKYEGVDLAVLRSLFGVIGSEPVMALVRSEPTGSYARRIWFLYEWLKGETLDLADAKAGRYVEIVDHAQQYCVSGQKVTRQRVIDNLPGVRGFCPMVFRTPILDEFISQDLSSQAKQIISAVPRDLLARTASFLLLKDSRSSYVIEGENPPPTRIQRWGRAISEAGINPLSKEELLRLQKLVIGDARFVRIGLRVEGGFVGSHDRKTGMPLPEHISAPPQSLNELTAAMVNFSTGPAKKLDPVIAAAVLAFGFIYIHPFEDGNGRLHRYLIHHVMARAGFTPPGFVFPVSTTILNRIEEYKNVLEGYSGPLLSFIEWEPTSDGNVKVINDTSHYYSYFDATSHAEFLYSCVEQTITCDLPEETDFLRKYDQFKNEVALIIDLPDRIFDLLLRFLRQNDGVLSKKAQTNQFKALTSNEVKMIETQYQNIFRSN